MLRFVKAIGSKSYCLDSGFMYRDRRRSYLSIFYFVFKRTTVLRLVAIYISGILLWRSEMARRWITFYLLENYCRKTKQQQQQQHQQQQRQQHQQQQQQQKQLKFWILCHLSFTAFYQRKRGPVTSNIEDYDYPNRLVLIKKWCNQWT